MENKPKPAKQWRGGLPSVVTPSSNDDSTIENQLENLSSFCFPNIPVHFPLKKKIMLAKTTTLTGLTWENLQLMLSVAACVLMILDAYFFNSYDVMRVIYTLDIAITQVFVVDFALQTYVRSDPWRVLFEISSIFDIITIVPAFLYLVYPDDMRDGPFFAIYCCRLFRSVRLFKIHRRLSGKNKHIAMLAILLLCSSFFVAGVFYYLENFEYRSINNCRYIGASTEWMPSCAPYSLVEKDDDCDCRSCWPYYQYHDGKGSPGRVRCNHRSFFDAIYVTLITGTAIGYGDVTALYVASRSVAIFFIIATLIAVPIQINSLLSFMTSLSPFRAPYSGVNQECHVILSGYVNDKRKLEKFFKEFFHPDRLLTSTEEYHVVILGLGEPSEEVRSLLVSPMLDTRVTYVIGSALSVEDLKRVRADTAAGMFFLCNTEVHESSVHIEDAATVLRSLSVANFNPSLRSLVQIIKPEDKGILKDSDVDVILCLDEFKTALIARNAICPGFSTFIENIFHSFGNVSTELEESMDPWCKEYLHGARKEIYYAKLSELFLRAMAFDFRNIVPSIYIEFGVMVLGACDLETEDIILNPSIKDMVKADGKTRYTSKEFFHKYNVAVVLADDQLEADEMVRALQDPMRIEGILERVRTAESSFKTKHFTFSEADGGECPKQNLKKIVKNVVSPMRSSAKLAQGRLNNKCKTVQDKDAASGSELRSRSDVLNPSPKDSNQKDESSSDDENETVYIGLRAKRIVTELSSSAQGMSMFKKIIAKKREIDGTKAATDNKSVENRIFATQEMPLVLVAAPVAAGPADRTASVTPDLTRSNAFATGSDIDLEVGKTTSSKVGNVSSMIKISGNNQGTDLLLKTVSNDQVMKALKRKSEPAESGSKNSDKGVVLPTSTKRKSEPPPARSNIEDCLVSSPLRDKPFDIRGPPVAMTNPKSPLVSGKFNVSHSVSFDESDRVLDENIEEGESALSSSKGVPGSLSRKLKPLSKKESSDKISARKSAKIKKIREQVRSNVVVVTSSSSGSRKIPSKTRSRKEADGFEVFNRLESDITDNPSKDSLEDLSPTNYHRGIPEQGAQAPMKLDKDMTLERLSTLRSPTRSTDAPDSQGAKSVLSDPEEEKIDATTETSKKEPRSYKMSDIVGTLMTVTRTVKKWTEFFGKSSCEIESAEKLDKHIVVFGATPSELILFISELRRPAVRRADYHSIVIVDMEAPKNWSAICDRYNDVYFLNGFLTKTSTFKKLNIDQAFSVVLFTFNDPRMKGSYKTSASHHTPDADALFMYLKLQPYIPEHVFFFVELKTSSNISVLNATMMRRLREQTLRKESSNLSTEPRISHHSANTIPGLIPPLLSSLSSKYFRANDLVDTLPIKTAGSIKTSRKVNILEEKKSVRMFWDAMDTHHVLPVFASGKVYVPETFETLLVQSFYNSMTPIICDKLVCGQKGQAVLHAKLPAIVDGWSFLQLFRMFCQFNVIVFGLYRATSLSNNAPLPYIYICPPLSARLRKGDCVMVYARNTHLVRALKATEKLSNLEYRHDDVGSSQ